MEKVELTDNVIYQLNRKKDFLESQFKTYSVQYLSSSKKIDRDNAIRAKAKLDLLNEIRELFYGKTNN